LRAAFEGIRSEAIVLLAFLIIGEDRVRLAHLFELRLGISFGADVRVVLLGEPLVGFLDLFFRRVLRNAERLVVVHLSSGSRVR